jgi:integrase
MRDPFASRPLTDGDLAIVLAAADRMKVRHRDGSEDPIFAGRLVRVMATFGPHVSVLSGGVRQRTNRATREITYREDPPLSSTDLRSEAGQLYLAWRRPKTGQSLLIPVPKSMATWLGDFLDSPRSRRRAWYNELLTKLERDLAANGTPVKLSPSRFRHTAAVRLRKMGLLQEDIEDMLGVSPQTLRHYINRTTEERTADLKSRGWDSTLS